MCEIPPPTGNISTVRSTKSRKAIGMPKIPQIIRTAAGQPGIDRNLVVERTGSFTVREVDIEI